MKKVLAMVLALCMVLSLAACAGNAATEPATTETAAPAENAAESTTESSAPEAAADEGDIVFGLTIGLTGSLALEGDRVVKSVNMAIDEINEAGGVLGRKLAVVVEDDGGDADTANTVVKKMGENKNIIALLGPHMTNSVLAVDQTLRDYTLPAFVGGTALSISELDNPYVFRTRSSDRLNAAAAVKYLVEDLGYTKIGLLYNNVELGIGAKSIIEDYLATKDLKLVAAEAHTPGDVDMTGQILNVKNAGAEAVIVWCFPAEAAITVRQIKELGLDVPVIGGATFTSIAYYDALDETVCDGTYAVTDFVISDPDSAEFVQKFEDRYNGDKPENSSFEYYDAVYMLAAAIETAGVAERQAIADAILQTTIDGNQGKLYVDEYHDLVHKVIIARNNGKTPEALTVITEYKDPELDTLHRCRIPRRLCTVGIEGSMSTIIQLLVTGIAMGFIYCMVATEYTLLYNTTVLINFAHEKFITLGAYFFGGTMYVLFRICKSSVAHPTSNTRDFFIKQRHFV